jgi:transposase
MGGVSSSLVPEAVMAIVCVGGDLAKNVFAIHGVDDVGKAVWVQARVPRARLLAAFSHLPPCLIDLVTCWSAQHRARHVAA